MEVAGCGDGTSMTAYDIGFRLGPRINAAGRMDAARAVVELFSTQRQRQRRGDLAKHLDTRNQERKAGSAADSRSGDYRTGKRGRRVRRILMSR